MCVCSVWVGKLEGDRARDERCGEGDLALPICRDGRTLMRLDLIGGGITMDAAEGVDGGKEKKKFWVQGLVSETLRTKGLCRYK